MPPPRISDPTPDYAHLPPLADHQNLAETVYQYLLAAISGLSIRPGETLNEVRLAHRLGVSVTPVREALLRLSSDGLVVREPQRKPRVVLLSEREIEELYDVRGALESFAAAEAATHATDEDLKRLERLQHEGQRLADGGDPERYDGYNDEVHETVMRLAGNHLLLRMMQPIRVKIRLCMSITSMLPGRRLHGVMEHEKLIGLIRAGDASGASHAMREHCTAAKRAFLENYSRIETMHNTTRKNGFAGDDAPTGRAIS